MNTERFTIKNRHGLKLVIQVDTPENPKNLVFISHGQGGFLRQLHIQAFMDAFLESNFRVVRFDATNSIGESGGDIINVTTTNYLEDLEDVITWAKTRSWFQQPFALCGHSMGGMSVALYAERHPANVSLLAPLSSVISYDLSMETRDPSSMRKWKSDGYQESQSLSKPGIIKRIGWGYMEDLKKYDLLKNANKLSMPILLLVGDRDKGTPYEHQMKLFEAIPHQNKKIIKIKDADHNFRDSGDYMKKLKEVKNIISEWLKSTKNT